MKRGKNYLPKEKFIERMKVLLNGEEDVKYYFKSCKSELKKALRVNTLKITPVEMVERLVEKGWGVKQPFKEHPEIIIVESELKPGEIGKTKEHVLGYYYVQEVTSMMPLIALGLNEKDNFLDLCAAPGSKTTQSAAIMNNKGSIIANDVSIGRISILNANLERCGVTNTIVTRHNAVELCNKLKKLKFKFNKILVDAPCSGEGNIRYSPRIFLEWSEGLLKALSRKQKTIASAAVELLDEGGEMIYSTCTHSPEENECVVQHLLDNFKLEIKKFELPLIFRSGLKEWKGEKFDEGIRDCARIYPHDNDMEGFFVAKLVKIL